MEIEMVATIEVAIETTAAAGLRIRAIKKFDPGREENSISIAIATLVNFRWKRTTTQAIFCVVVKVTMQLRREWAQKGESNKAMEQRLGQRWPDRVRWGGFRSK